MYQYDTIRGKNSGRMRARKNGIHSQYAGEAPDVREAEQNAEDYRHCRGASA